MSGGWQRGTRLFPEAQLWAPRPTPFTLKKGHLPFTGILGDEPPQAWTDDFDQLAFKGNPLSKKSFSFTKSRARSSWMI